MSKYVKYVSNEIETIHDLEEGSNFPPIDGNILYEAYKIWVNEGNTAQTKSIDETPYMQVVMLQKAEKGRKLKELASHILHIIAGHNHDNNLDTAQIVSLKSSNPEAFALLSDGQPYSAKPYLDAVEADGVIITEEEILHVQEAYRMFEEANPEFKA